MVQFYICPLIQHRMPRGTYAPVGRVFRYRSHGERYTLHRGLGQSVICSLENPAIETQAGIAGDQECIEWPELQLIWGYVGESRRKAIIEVLSAHGVPLSWIGLMTTSGDILEVALMLSLSRQQNQLPAIAMRASSASAENEVYDELRKSARKSGARIDINGVKFDGFLHR